MLAAARQGKMHKYKILDMHDNDLRKQHYFMEYHPGHFHAYLKRRKHIVIPKVLMKQDMLCNFADLALDEKSPSESVLVTR